MKKAYPDLKATTILGIAAHPDDLDFAAGGTIAKLIKQGATAYYLILTNGNKGAIDPTTKPRQLSQVRRQEQHKAAQVLGLTDVFFLDYEDGQLENTQVLKHDIVRYIRKLKPDTIFTLDPAMLYAPQVGLINHPDHRAAGQATLDAVYPLARDPLCFPELASEGLKPHTVQTILLTNYERHNYCVDIGDTVEQKQAALAAHTSQHASLQHVQPMLDELTNQAGKAAGCSCGEAFIRIDVTS